MWHVKNRYKSCCCTAQEYPASILVKDTNSCCKYDVVGYCWKFGHSNRRHCLKLYIITCIKLACFTSKIYFEIRPIGNLVVLKKRLRIKFRTWKYSVLHAKPSTKNWMARKQITSCEIEQAQIRRLSEFSRVRCLAGYLK